MRYLSLNALLVNSLSSSHITEALDGAEISLAKMRLTMSHLIYKSLEDS